MTDPIEILESRDDVEKTEYARYNSDGEKTTVELWHDTSGLQAIFQKSIDGTVSEKGIRQYAKKQAIATRETRVDPYVELGHSLDNED